MKKFALILAATGFPLSSLHAQNSTVPLYVNYQGKLTGGNGAPLGATGTAPNFIAAPENRKMIFRLYDAQTGGQKLWSEQQTVTVSLGEFSVLLGQGTDAVFDSVTETPRPFLDTVFGGPAGPVLNGPNRYLEIVVDDGNGTFTSAADAAIAPRQRITTTAYSFRARLADTVAPGAIDATALGTGSVSSSKIVDAAITTEKIQDGSVGVNDIANGSVNSAKIADGTIVAGDLADNSVNSAKIADGSVTNSDLSDNSVNGNKIADGSVGGADIANGAITSAKLDLNGIGLWSTNGAHIYRNTGNVGIGTSAPPYPLSFNSVIGDKICLWGPSAGPHYGFGINNSLLQIHTDGSSGDIAFGYGTHAAMTETMRIKGNGNVGIGNSNPDDKLVISGLDGFTGRALKIDNGGGRYIRMYRSINGFVISGNLMPQFGNNFSQIQWDGDGNWDQSSDRTLKKDITDAEEVLGKLMQMPVRRYHWKTSPSDAPKKFGVIAQEVQPLFPELISSMRRDGDAKETMTVKYGAFGLIAAKAVQELKTEKDDEINALREENTALKKRLAALEAKEDARDEKLVAIEKLLQAAAGKDAVRTVALKKGKAAE